MPYTIWPREAQGLLIWGVGGRVRLRERGGERGGGGGGGDTCRLPLLFNTCSLMTLSNFIASYRESHGHPAVHPSECVENMCVAGKKHNINCVCCVHSFQLHVCFFYS